MTAIDEEYLTVAEAAMLLRVAPSTIRRWIRQGDVPAYRLGQRRIVLRRADLATLITPVQVVAENGGHAGAAVIHRSLTPEEKQRVLEGMGRAERPGKGRWPIAVVNRLLIWRPSPIAA
jgi:excisionase family DNA binding protein